MEEATWIRVVLSVCGLGAWLVAGGTRIAEGADLPFLVAWLAYGGAFVAAMASRALVWARAFTLAQLVFALVLLGLGMPHFEGALFAVSFAQLRRTTTPKIAVALVVLLVVPHFAVVLPSHGVLGALKASGELLAFGLFAVVLYDLVWREREARRSQQRIAEELVKTRALLAESVRAGEQRRIGRDLHDALGYHVEVLRDRLVAQPAHDEALRALDALVGQIGVVLRSSSEQVDLDAALRALAAGLPRVPTSLKNRLTAPTEAERAWIIIRAAQESLTNAARHQESPRMTWTVESRDGSTAFVARSVGARRDGSTNTRRGLTNLEARAADVGGTFVAGWDGEAFSVELVLPSPDASP